jgi:phosphatidylglycerophosphatase A
LSALFAHPANPFALGFGSGLAPWAPGTFGTLAAVPLWWLLAGFPLPVYLAVTALVIVFGVWCCGAAADALGVHDHPGIVWDEFAGLLVTMIALPREWGWIVAGFLLFRFFDILKPWPIRWLDTRVPGGLGIMLDDLLAGVFALVLLQLARVWLA